MRNKKNQRAPILIRKNIFCELFTLNLPPQLLFLRWIQLPQSGFAFQARVLVLFDSNLHTVLYVGYRIVGIILARSRSCAGSCIVGCNNPSHYGNANVRYQCITAACILHKSHWRMDWRVSDIRFRCAAGVRPRQLCVSFRLVENQLISTFTVDSVFGLSCLSHSFSLLCLESIKKTADSCPSW